MMHNLVIDIRPLLPKNPPTGVPEYTRELLRSLLPLLDKRNDVRTILFSSGQERPDLSIFNAYKGLYQHYHLVVPNKLLNASFKILGWPRIDALVRNHYKIPAKELITVFAPNINLLPLSKNARLIITFHDLSFERYPFFLKSKEVAWHWVVNPYRLSMRAQKIIAVSQSTRQDVISRYGIPSKKIHVVYSGLAQGFAPVKKRKTERHNILYLGSSEGRKNIASLLEAFKMLAKRLPGHELELVLAGPPHHTVSFEQRIRLYQEASLFVYPSFFEGFGLPPLEAMRSGVPVISANTSSLPEAVGDAALMVNPHRPLQLAYAMESLLLDSTLKERYIKKGFEQAGKFSWEKAAQETLTILLNNE